MLMHSQLHIYPESEFFIFYILGLKTILITKTVEMYVNIVEPLRKYKYIKLGFRKVIFCLLLEITIYSITSLFVSIEFSSTFPFFIFFYGTDNHCTFVGIEEKLTVEIKKY